MKSSTGFEPVPVSAPVLDSAPTLASYQVFQAKSFFANRKLKIQNLIITISKRCFDFL